MATKPQIVSATLIVRNEERFLAGCLASLRGVADETVVVDTGSSDATRQIAVEYGARVFDFPWRDDFSAARNYAIERARGSWILYIDADERVRAGDFEAVKRELADRRMIACTVCFYPITGCTAYREYRLFRRDERIRFEGAMHETMVPSLRRLVEAGHGHIGQSSLTLDHLGYDGDQKHKLERNMRLLLKETAADPDRLFLWWHLGTVYRDLGRTADAIATWHKGIRLATASSFRFPEDGLCFIELARLLATQGKDPLPLIERGLALQPGNYMLQWLKGKALLARQRYDAAVPIFEALAAVDADTLVADASYDKRIFGAWAFAELGGCAFRLGRYEESEQWYDRAEERAPGSFELRVKRQLARSRLASDVAGGGAIQGCHL